jgi:polysaccharide biosynthesis transport protein
MTTELGAAPSLRTYLIVVRRRKWWLTLFALLGLAASLAFSLTETKEYSATAQLLVQPSGAVAFGAYQPPVTPTEVQTELQLIMSAPVTEAVRQRIGTVPAVSAAQVAQTNVISITASSRTPLRAAIVANTYAKAFVSYRQSVASSNLAAAEGQLQSQVASLGTQIKSLEGKAGTAAEVTALVNQEAVLKEQVAQTQVSGAVATGGVEVVTPARPPASPSSPKPARDGALGLAAGLLVGLGIAFARDNLDEALSSKEGAESLAGASVLVMVPTVTSWKKRKSPLLVSTAQPTAPSAEAYRSLRTALQFARQERELRSILITSPAADEGKTSTTANLGVVFAQAGERVVLVSCDLRRPRLGHFFGIDEQVGLTTVLSGEHSLERALQPVSGHQSLWVLPSGPVPSNPAELLSEPGTRKVFDALKQSFDLVLVDSPPLLPVTDAVVLSKQVDGTLLVVAPGQTRRVTLRRSSEKLAQVNAPVVGLVLNGVNKQSGYGYGYGYHYYSRAREAPPGNGAGANGKTAVASAASKGDQGSS